MGGVIHPLHQVDLLTPAERKITEKEYWAQRRGQEKLDELNQKMKEDGITPKETRYQTENNFFVTLLMMLQAPPNHQRNFQKSLMKNITSSSRSVETDTAIFTLAEKNISLKGILEPDTQKIFS